MKIQKQYAGYRNSFMKIGEPYFWTSTINRWMHLLGDEDFKWIVINSLKWLFERQLISVYAFVIMPNHIHFLWEQLKMNGKEHPKNSFQRFTGHEFLKMLQNRDPRKLKKFENRTNDRNYLFWKRDPLAVLVNGREMAEQKLDYIHSNPLQKHWHLCNDPIDYRFSSFRFYEKGKDEFGILTHYHARF